MSIQFISCLATSCPLNEDKQCRSPSITVDADGKCMIRDAGPYNAKSETENYVNLQNCSCKGCRHWEGDDSDTVGQCGFRENLFFSLLEGEEIPTCDEFQRRIGQPGFMATL